MATILGLAELFSISNKYQYGRKNYSVLQPNLFYTFSKGQYIATELLWVYDYILNTWTISLNLRFGYIFQTKKFKFNTYI
jgi:hypothetical protein